MPVRHQGLRWEWLVVFTSRGVLHLSGWGVSVGMSVHHGRALRGCRVLALCGQWVPMGGTPILVCVHSRVVHFD